jgi:hypothetical protein
MNALRWGNICLGALRITQKLHSGRWSVTQVRTGNTYGSTCEVDECVSKRAPKKTENGRSARVLTIPAHVYSISYSVSDMLCIFEIQTPTLWNLIDCSITAPPHSFLLSRIFPARSFYFHITPASKIGANGGKKCSDFSFFISFKKCATQKSSGDCKLRACL